MKAPPRRDAPSTTSCQALPAAIILLAVLLHRGQHVLALLNSIVPRPLPLLAVVGLLHLVTCCTALSVRSLSPVATPARLLHSTGRLAPAGAGISLLFGARASILPGSRGDDCAEDEDGERDSRASPHLCSSSHPPPPTSTTNKTNEQRNRGTASRLLVAPERCVGPGHEEAQDLGGLFVSCGGLYRNFDKGWQRGFEPTFAPGGA